MLHGNRTYLLQDADGQILEGHSISAGLDYPGVGPEHAWLRDTGRVTYVPVTDKEALHAWSAPRPRASSGARKRPWAGAGGEARPHMGREETIVLCLSGRGDKDVESVGKHLGMSL